MKRSAVVCLVVAGCLEPGEVPPRHDAGAIDVPLAVFDARPPDAPRPAMPDAQNCMGPLSECRNWDAGCHGTFVAGLCPGPTYYQCCVFAAAAPKCDESSFPTPNGGVVEEPGAGGCPNGMVRVASFCIDKFEAALVEVAGDGTTSPWSPYENPGGRRVRAISARRAVPQGYISGAQAAAACAQAGKRLCTDVEWKRACQGPDGLTFPYGNVRAWGTCNDHRDVHPAVELFGSVTNLGSPCINQLHDTVDRTGDRTGCVTVEGAYDMVGNLHEWTADPNGTFRGGFYVDTVVNGQGCNYATTAHDTSYWDYSTGFRCCSDP
ncbi:MAG TPA: SUMF1/EgtB/PvdO family nonheme iron enzyme [Haliangiales bacterium]|nr:SUMF1/EgtB/PvdO family nonheme iron enzyme [Haliangiales bacterium]